jgi:hypothetical protein
MSYEEITGQIFSTMKGNSIGRLEVILGWEGFSPYGQPLLDASIASGEDIHSLPRLFLCIIDGQGAFLSGRICRETFHTPKPNNKEEAL